MSRRPLLALLPVLLPLLLPPASLAAPPELVDFDWRMEDVVLVFGDSVGYEVDLAASDTSQVVVRIPRATLGESLMRRASGTETQSAPAGGTAISIMGRRGGRGATIAPSKDGLSLRVHGDDRLGYSIEWRPYTRQLVVHTFEWSRLSYGESQFHQGLIALEQGAIDQAEELLQVAGASGEERAHGVLASLYARRGADSLARYFLRSPRDAEELAALADVQMRAGDTAAAEESRRRSGEILAGNARERGTGRQPFGDEPGDADAGVRDANVESDTMPDRDVLLLAAIGGLALLLIIGLIVLSTRGSRRREATVPVRPVTPPPPVRPESAGFRVVERPGAPPVEEPPSTATSEQDMALAAGSSSTADEPLQRTHAPREWSSSQPEHRPGATQADELRERMREADASNESTIDTARRLHVSRDNIELRRKMEERRGR